MRQAILTRRQEGQDGTFGNLVVDDHEWKTGELPWYDNARSVSCIPVGEYQCVWSHSPKFGWVYEVTNVPMRSHILIHAGNYCGDEEIGMKSDTDGCILLGKLFGRLNGQNITADSRVACDEFAAHMEKMPFKLIIRYEGDDDGLEQSS